MKLPAGAGNLFAACLLCGLAGCTSRTMLRTGFETDPFAAGWESDGTYRSGRSDFRGQLSEVGGTSGGRCLRVRKGLWQTPPIPVRPLEYYRARFAARADAESFYVFRFLDAKGRELDCDEHNALHTSPRWERHEAFTQVREGAVAMRLAFIPGGYAETRGSELWIDDVRVSRASARQALAWNDRLYRTLPPVNWTPPADRWKHLGRTRALLQEGAELRVVLLGDSIANDMGNSQFHLMIQRIYRGSRVVLLRSIRGGTGCQYYKKRVREYVADRTPDLVIIGGISHSRKADAQAIRAVIEETRRLTGRPVEFLVLTGAICEPGMNWGWKSKGLDSPSPKARQAAVEQERRLYARLMELRDELRIATLDMRTVWEDYLTGSGRPLSWYQRDFTHANSRGKQVLGRIMQQFFSPE